MNPTLSAHIPIYQKMRDTMSSEEHMKDRALAQNPATGFCQSGKITASTKFGQYLRPTDGMIRSEHGYQRFCKFIWGAKYYPYPQETRDQGLGMIQNEPPVIELPTSLEFMRDNATANYESLEKVMAIVNSEQMIVSRVGLLLSPIQGISSEPYNMWVYKAEAIQNWHEIIDKQGEKDIDWLVLLTNEMKDDKPVYQVLYLQDGIYSTYKTTSDNIEYGVYELSGDEYIADSWMQPDVKQSKLERIPFVVINTQRLGYDFEKPFLEPLSDASIKCFQASARNEDNLEHGGKNTTYTQGFGAGKDASPIYQGNGAVNRTDSDSANVWMITAGVDGIEPTSKDLENKKADCVALGVDLVNQGVESGVALATRANIKTASLKTLAKTCAEGIERLLKIGAVWIGANPDDVSIIANTTFADPVYTADDLPKLKIMVDGGAMSKEALFNIMKKMDLTAKDTFEEESLIMEIEVQKGVSL